MAESSVGKELDDQFLQCPICIERFSNPKLLPKCGHIVCLTCLNGIVSQNYGRLKCPICRVDNSSFIRGKGVDGLPDSFTTNALIEFVENKKKEEASHFSGDPCGICGRSSVAYCTVCDQLQCQECQNRHMKITVTRNHTMVPIEEYHSTPKNLLRPANCSRHSGHQVQMYCETCQVAVCMECILSEHQGGHHKHVSLKTAAEKKREKLADLVSSMNKKLPELQVASDTMGCIREDLIRERSALYKRVSARTSAILQEVKQYEQSLLQQIQDHYTGHLNALEKAITRFDDMVKQGDKITTIATELLWSDIDSLVFYLEKQHLSKLQEIVSQKTAIPTSTKKPIEFHSEPTHDLKLTDVIGTVRVKGSQSAQPVSSEEKSFVSKSSDFKLKTAVSSLFTKSSDESSLTYSNSRRKFQRTVVIDRFGKLSERQALQKPRGLSLTNDDNHFYVAAMGNDRILKYTLGGSYKSQMHIRSPFDVAAIRTLSSIDGNILLTDGTSLYRCNDAGEMYFSEDYGQTSDALGLATDASQSKVFLLLATDKTEACIDSSVSHLQLNPPVSDAKQHRTVVFWDLGSRRQKQEIDFEGDARFLTANSLNQIITADSSACKVMVYDGDSKQILFSFGSKGQGDGQFENPLGVATDADDNIFVCSKGRVQLFTNGGRFICRLDKPSDQLVHPVSICVTKRRPCKVIVTDEDEAGVGKIVIYKEIPA
ncbi:tripartite motif-containing protein 2-like [Ptychodera flava]|uniref:tripartite motif-containing protein 2-like n=1 Tax=Ptychodera flava TaxID=63121 RepID=UPI003969C04E